MHATTLARMGALLLALLAAPQALADVPPPSRSELAEQKRIRQRAAKDRARCNTETQQGPSDRCFTCSGDFRDGEANACEEALARYGFVRTCSVHSGNQRPLAIEYTLSCRSEQGDATPLPCRSLTAIESLTVELKDHEGLCTRVAQQRPDEQCVRCSASPEACQELAEVGFSERCEARWASGNRRAALWCRASHEPLGVHCQTLAHLNQPSYTGSPISTHRALSEETDIVAATYTPPAPGSAEPMPPEGPPGVLSCTAVPTASPRVLWPVCLMLLLGLRRRASPQQ